MNEIMKIPVDKIIPNPFQPRKRFSHEEMRELAHSIKVSGLLQPIIVRQSFTKDGYFEVIAGERRLKAFQGLKIEEIDCIVKNYDDESTMRLTTIENIQRQDLNPIEEARAYKQLKDVMKLKQDEISNIASKSRSKIANSMRLLELPEKIQELISEEIISGSFGRTLLSLNEPKLIESWGLDENIQKLSISELTKKIKQYQEPKKEKIESNLQEEHKLEDYKISLEENLNRYLDNSKIKIQKTKNETYKLQIEIKDEEEMKKFLSFTNK